MDEQQIREEIAIEEEILRRKSSKQALYTPNPKQWEFCNAGGPGSRAHEIMLSGPNQVGGKTYTLRYLIAVHAEGSYPDGWEGPRFEKPPVLAIAGDTHVTTRDQLTDELLGTDGARGTGWIPESEIGEIVLMSRPKGAVDYFTVRHKGSDGQFNGYTKIYVFNYTAGWKRIAGYTIDGIFLNEMPRDPVYDEMKARINATMGYIWIAMCPQGEIGYTYQAFEKDESGYLHLVQYGIDECTHLTKEEYEFNYNRWKDHPEAEARLYGKPCRGTGLIYFIDRDRDIVPPSFPSEGDLQIIGVDFPHGTGFFAAVKCTYNKESGILTVVDEFKAQNQETAIYKERLRIMGGERIPIAWPHDGGTSMGSTTSGGTVAENYRKSGLDMLRDSAFVYEGSKRVNKIMIAVEAIQERLATGTLKISQMCPQLLEEMRTYSHIQGKIRPKQDDHLIDALHKAVFMLRYAKVPADKAKEPPNYQLTKRRRVDEFDFFDS